MIDWVKMKHHWSSNLIFGTGVVAWLLGIFYALLYWIGGLPITLATLRDTTCLLSALFGFVLFVYFNGLSKDMRRIEDKSAEVKP